MGRGISFIIAYFSPSSLLLGYFTWKSFRRDDIKTDLIFCFLIMVYLTMLLVVQ
jgi:hypothetical protein